MTMSTEIAVTMPEFSNEGLKERGGYRRLIQLKTRVSKLIILAYNVIIQPAYRKKSFAVACVVSMFMWVVYHEKTKA